MKHDVDPPKHLDIEETGIQTVLHLTCRDRNILGLQAQIMGAHVLGLEAMMKRTQHLNLLIFTGIFPLISARNADFLHNEIPGISIPREIREPLWKYEKVEDQRKAALDLTRKLIADITPFADGLYLISPLNKWEIPLTLVQEVIASGH